MERYLQQLLADIQYAMENIQTPWVEKESYELDEWKSEEEDLLTAPRRTIEEWTGIQKIQLPPHERLTDDMISRLLKSLKELLETINCLVVFQMEVPERIQYRVIRDRFDQESSFLMWHMNFFDFCDEGQTHHSCSLGDYCHCAYFADLLSGFSDEEDFDNLEIDPEEMHLRRKYGDRWHLYYFFEEDDEDPEDDF